VSKPDVLASVTSGTAQLAGVRDAVAGGPKGAIANEMISINKIDIVRLFFIVTS